MAANLSNHRPKRCSRGKSGDALRNATDAAVEAQAPLDAWRTLSIEHPIVECAELFRCKRRKEVWTLSGPGGVRVIAKRCRPHEARCEHLVYRNVLPGRGLGTPDYYGRVDVGDGRSTWVFVEEVAGQPYSADVPLHRELAAGWLARLHATTREQPPTDGLPSVDPCRYRRMLADLTNKMPAYMANPALRRDDLFVLEELIEMCRTLLDDWHHIENASARMPRALVHGSFSRRNMLVSSTSAGPALRVFDWGASGWGVPARDLAKLVTTSIRGSLETYGRCFADLDAADLDHLVALGRLFRAVEHVAWITPRLQYRWIEKPMRKLAKQRSSLATAAESVRRWSLSTLTPRGE